MNRRGFLQATSLAALGLAQAPGCATSRKASPIEAVLENESCRIAFDSGLGGLLSLWNVPLDDECLKGGQAGGRPFRIFADMNKEFEIGHNEKYQLTFEDPASITRNILQPGACTLVHIHRQKHNLQLTYAMDGFELQLQIILEPHSGVSDWSLQITNTGTAARDVLVCFPYLDGVQPGPDPKNNLATAMDQAGLIVPAWERPGGVLGESNQMSMQWHAVWDPATRSALGLLFMDAEVRPKRLVLDRSAASIALHYFPPVRLEPNAAHTAPPMRMLIYQGDWRPAARNYREWHDRAYARPKPPDWFRASNGHTGIHFKKAGPGIASKYSGQMVLNSFRELPAAHIQAPLDNFEYAFYCRTSMLDEGKEYAPHTDGDNIIREDLGGAEALREGIAGMHRLGLHATLYVEGYIVHEESELVKSGRGLRWSIMRKNGAIDNPYRHQGFYPMCPGCVEWQDYLAGMVARLLRETGADGVRLDSLGFYYLPCYNPAHQHETPFGYNQWIQQLLAKVYQAATAAKPDVLLLTEGSADWYTPWVHGALTSRCPRDLSPMRIAVGGFGLYVYSSGVLWGSLSGYQGGSNQISDLNSPDWRWICAQAPVHDALVWGEVPDSDPACTDPEIVTRCFYGKGYTVIVAARPACQDSIWPRGTGLSSKHAPYTITVFHLPHPVEEAVLCDVETLHWRALTLEQHGGMVQFSLETNWALVVLRPPHGPRMVDVAPLPALSRGASTLVRPSAVNGALGDRVTIHAPGLNLSREQVTCPETAEISVPADAFPGNYAVSVSGDNVLGGRRYLVIRDQ